MVRALCKPESGLNKAKHTLRVFSNWEHMRVIMPKEAMKDSLLRTCRTTARSSHPYSRTDGQSL